MSNRVLFCGAGYGAGNIGDDAILAGLLRSSCMYLRSDTEYGAITFGSDLQSRNPKITHSFSSHKGVDAAFQWATHIVLGGASLLAAGSIAYCSHLIRLAYKMNKPVCMLGVGVSNQLSDDFKRQVQIYYGRLNMITLRSDADKVAAIAMGLSEKNLYVCADGAFAINYGNVITGSENILGINLVHEELPSKHPYVETVTSLLIDLSSNMSFSFICEETRKDVQYDFFLLQNLFKKFGGNFFYDYVNYHTFLKILAKCRIIITMRMHIMVFCALLDIPCLPIIRESKMKMMADTLGLNHTASLDEDLSTMKHLVTNALQKPETFKANKIKVEALKKRAFENGFMLQKWMSNTL